MGKRKAAFSDQAGTALTRSGVVSFDLGSRSRLRCETCYGLNRRAPRVPHQGIFRLGLATILRLLRVRESSVKEDCVTERPLLAYHRSWTE